MILCSLLLWDTRLRLALAPLLSTWDSGPYKAKVATLRKTHLGGRGPIVLSTDLA